jgi:hypothetical protein
MDGAFLNELSDLLRETENLLAGPEPERKCGRLTGAGASGRSSSCRAKRRLAADHGGERARLRELIEAILERDRLLMVRLELYLARCRKGLSTVPKVQQALRGYFPPQPGALQRQV